MKLEVPHLKSVHEQVEQCYLRHCCAKTTTLDVFVTLNSKSLYLPGPRPDVAIQTAHRNIDWAACS